MAARTPLVGRNVMSRHVGLVAGGLVLALAGSLVHATSTAADPAGVTAAARKPRPGPTASATPTPTPAPTPAPTPTATPAPTPTPPAPDCDATVIQDSQTWCSGTIAGVDGGQYGVGSRVVLQGLIVESVDGPDVAVLGFWCPEGYFCGAIMQAMTIDFSGLADIPTADSWIDVYGITGAPGAFQPVDFTTVG